MHYKLTNHYKIDNILTFGILRITVINIHWYNILECNEMYHDRFGKILKGRLSWFMFIMGSLLRVSEKNGFDIALCCLAICWRNKSSFVVLYSAMESMDPGGVTQSFFSGELVSPSDSSDIVRLCFPSAVAASRSCSMKGALLFCGNTFSRSRNPFANGLLSIFSCVICAKIGQS